MNPPLNNVHQLVMFSVLETFFKSIKCCLENKVEGWVASLEGRVCVCVCVSYFYISARICCTDVA